MDDIFVIIVTLIIAVVGALNQKRKKKQGQQAPVGEPTEEPKQDIWDMLFDQGEQPIVPKPQYVDYEEEVEEKPKMEERPVFESSISSAQKTKYDFRPKSEGVSAVSQEIEKKPLLKRKAKILGEDFSLKKAVIYSEILNRKYS